MRQKFNILFACNFKVLSRLEIILGGLKNINICSVSVQRFWISMVRIFVIAVLWMLVTACFPGSPVSPPAAAPPDACGDKAPVVTSGRLERTSEPDPAILARRVLEIPDFPGYGLIGEIERVLGIIRSAWPEMAEVNARPRWEPGTLILRLEPSLFKAVSAAICPKRVFPPPFALDTRSLTLLILRSAFEAWKFFLLNILGSS